MNYSASTFDSKYTNSDKNDNSLRKKVVVAGAIALLFGVASYSGRSPTTSSGSLLRSNQGTEIGICSTVKSQVKDAIKGLDLANKDPFTLDQDESFTKTNVQLDGKGCTGDVTVTLEKGATASGFGNTNIDFDEIRCSGFLSVDGQWEVESSNPNASVEIEATVKVVSSACLGGDTTTKATIKVKSPTISAKVSAKAGVNVFPPGGKVTALTVDNFKIAFAKAETTLVPGGEHDFTSAQADEITKGINDSVLPTLNAIIESMLPKTITI